jgi:hypothetical protein
MGVLSKGRNGVWDRVSVRVSVSIRIGILSNSQGSIQEVDGDGLLSAVCCLIHALSTSHGDGDVEFTVGCVRVVH